MTPAPADAALWCKTALLPQGWAQNVRISISGGKISDVEMDAAAVPGDAHAAVVAPGLPNLHSHTFQRAMAGLTETRGAGQDSFWTWRTQMYRFVERLDPEALEAIAALAFMEMLEAGFTRVAEFHYQHHDLDGSPYANLGEMAARLAAAADDTGLALTLLPVFYAHADFGGAPPAPGQRRFVNDLDRYARLLEASKAAIIGLPDAVLGVAPHSLRAATPEEIAAVAAMTDGPVHIHIAEQTKEVADCLAWSGKPPVATLLAAAPVDARWCLVHATHMTDAETAAVAASGAVVGLCPITEANLGDGVFPAQTFLEAGGSIGVGSDSNVRIDAAEELRLLEYSQRFTVRRRNVLATAAEPSTGGRLFRAALAGGGQATGSPARIVVGAAADLVSLDGAAPAMIARSGDALIDSWVFAGGRETVRDVWRAGRRVVADGRHVKREAIVARYAATLARIMA